MGGEARPRYLCAGNSFEPARVVLLGCPFDGTASFRRGAKFGPDAMRAASDCLETYSPGLDKDLSDAALCDLGDVDFTSDDTEAVLASIRAEASRIFRSGKRPIFLGGEHLVSLPLVEAALGVSPGLAVFQWDAHADLRDDYMGKRLSTPAPCGASWSSRASGLSDSSASARARARSSHGCARTTRCGP